MARKYDSKFLNREVNYLRNKGKVEKRIRRVKKKYHLNNWRDGLLSRKGEDLQEVYDDEEEDEEKGKCWYRCWYICCRKYCKWCKCCDKKIKIEEVETTK